MRQIWKQITGGGQGAGTDAPLAGEIDVADFAEALTAGSDLAIPAIRRVLADGSLEGADVGLYCFAADTARSLGHADLAIALLDQADATLEPSAAICEKRGFVALERRDLDDAAAAFRRGTEIDAAFLPNWYGLTLALHALGETDAALTAAGHVLDWDGKYAPEAFAAVVGDLATEAYTRGQRLPLRAAYAYLHAAGHGPIATIRYIDILNKSHERRLAREAVETLDLAHQRMGSGRPASSPRR